MFTGLARGAGSYGARFIVDIGLQAPVTRAIVGDGRAIEVNQVRFVHDRLALRP
jgi:hypothetical protein